MVSPQPNRIDPATARYPSSDAAELALIKARAREAIDQRGLLAQRRLRNRIIVANAVAWIIIIALIRLIFF